MPRFSLRDIPRQGFPTHIPSNSGNGFSDVTVSRNDRKNIGGVIGDITRKAGKGLESIGQYLFNPGSSGGGFGNNPDRSYGPQLGRNVSNRPDMSYVNSVKKFIIRHTNNGVNRVYGTTNYDRNRPIDKDRTIAGFAAGANNQNGLSYVKQRDPKTGKTLEGWVYTTQTPKDGYIDDSKTVRQNAKDGRGLTRYVEKNRNKKFNGAVHENWKYSVNMPLDRQRKSGPGGKVHNPGPEYKAWDLEDVLNTHGITKDRLKSKALLINRLNINRVIQFTEQVNFGKQYIFFSRPDLNIFVDNKGTVNPDIVNNCPDLYMKIMKNVGIARSLQSSIDGMSAKVGGGLLYLLSNMCNTCNVPDIELSTVKAAANSKGQYFSYGGDFFESMNEQSIDIDFLDNRDRDVATLIQIWTEYIEGVKNGSITKRNVYIANNVIDYAVNIFIFTLDEVHNIMSMGMLGACFPKSVNTQLINYEAVAKDATQLNGPFAYRWHASYMMKPDAHRIAEIFNRTTNFATRINIPNNEGAHKYMYKQNNGYWLHTGILPYAHATKKDYPYRFSLEDKWAELVGIGLNATESGVINYVLLFASKDVGTAKGPGSFYRPEHDPNYDSSSRRKGNNYLWQTDIDENKAAFKNWERLHPKYDDMTEDTMTAYKWSYSYDTSSNPGLWGNETKFNPDFMAWKVQHGGRGYNDMARGKWTSGNNRYGEFMNSGSNSAFYKNAISMFTNWVRGSRK